MSDSIQKMTARIFQAFGFHLDRRGESGSQRIREVLESSLKSTVYTASKVGPSLSAVGAARSPQTAAESAREYAIKLHREIYNRPVDRSNGALQIQAQRSDQAKFLIASALLFSKLQEDPANCTAILTAISPHPKVEIDEEGYGNFGKLFTVFLSLKGDDLQTNFRQLKAGAGGNQDSCSQFVQPYRERQVHQSWSQSFSGAMKCFETSGDISGCFSQK